MKILIAGAGGVGAYLGAKLSEVAGTEVTLLARGTHLRALERNGLRILEGKQSKRYTIPAVSRSDDLGVFDLIFLTIKSNDLEEMLKLISNNISQKTVIIPLLNGVDHSRIVERYHPEADLLVGCIYILSNILEPGVVRKRGDLFRLCWGHPRKDINKYQYLADLFDAAGFRHRATRQIEVEAWKKYLFISPMATLTSLYETSMDRIVTEEETLLGELISELYALARAKGIPLEEKLIAGTLDQARKTPPGAQSSMQIDLQRGKAAEIEALTGYPVREGQRLGLAMPAYEECYRKLLRKSVNPKRSGL